MSVPNTPKGVRGPKLPTPQVSKGTQGTQPIVGNQSLSKTAERRNKRKAAALRKSNNDGPPTTALLTAESKLPVPSSASKHSRNNLNASASDTKLRECESTKYDATKASTLRNGDKDAFTTTGKVVPKPLHQTTAQSLFGALPSSNSTMSLGFTVRNVLPPNVVKKPRKTSRKLTPNVADDALKNPSLLNSYLSTTFRTFLWIKSYPNQHLPRPFVPLPLTARMLRLRPLRTPTSLPSLPGLMSVPSRAKSRL